MVQDQTSLAWASFVPTEADVVAVHRRALLKGQLARDTHRKNWRNGIVAGVIVACSFALTAYVLTPDPARAMARAMFWLGAYAVLWPIYAWRNLTWKAFQKRATKAIGAAVRNGSIPVPSGPATVELTAQGVAYVEGSMHMTWEWSAISRVEVEHDAVYFEGSHGGMIRVPLTAFVRPADRDEFVRVARAAWGGDRATT